MWKGLEYDMWLFLFFFQFQRYHTWQIYIVKIYSNIVPSRGIYWVPSHSYHQIWIEIVLIHGRLSFWYLIPTILHMLCFYHNRRKGIGSTYIFLTGVRVPTKETPFTKWRPLSGAVWALGVFFQYFWIRVESYRLMKHWYLKQAVYESAKYAWTYQTFAIN